MNKQVEGFILKTLCYSDVFDYPLTKEEIRKFLIGKKISRESFEKGLTEFPPSRWELRWELKNKFYFLSGRGKIVQKRIKRQKESERKINVAKSTIRFFTFIPTIQFIGISGALSLRNCDKNDDIDLFVIASKGTLWLTRLIMILFLKIVGRYRSYNIRDVSDKICLNMLIDEEALSFPKERQNLYTAHEIVQMLPILNKNNTYEEFLSANDWINKFLPNAIKRFKIYDLRIKNESQFFIFHFSFLKNLPNASSFGLSISTKQPRLSRTRCWLFTLSITKKKF